MISGFPGWKTTFLFVFSLIIWYNKKEFGAKWVNDMQDVINRILEGNFETDNSSLSFSCTKLECTISQGADYEGSFRILSEEGSFTTGKIYSTDIRMECLTSIFTGNNEEISFCFHGNEMAEGEVVRGNFYIISNRGEYTLPFSVEFRFISLESSIGTIKNLFHFANLAKSSWEEAVKLFYNPAFEQVLVGNDAQYLEAYRHLSGVSGNEQNVEEFLIHINKKQKVEYLTEEKEIQLEAAGDFLEVLEKELHIVRNGWGYTRLYIELSGNFLFTEKEELSDDDFLGNRCRLPVYIDGSACRQGRNYGRIVLHNAFVHLEVPVTVRVNGQAGFRNVDLSRKKMVLRMMELYIDFRLKKLTLNNWIRETGKLVERMGIVDENALAPKLFQIQLLITEERYNEAGWLLSHVEAILDREPVGDVYRAYYLYLTTLVEQDEEYILQATDEVEYLYSHSGECWQIAWLLLYLSQEYNRSPLARLEFIQYQFDNGCRSPILYLEALTLMNNNPTLLRRLDSFELQVMYFGTRHQTIHSEVIEQLLYLTGKKREYNPVLLRILIALCGKKADSRLVQEICALLIKGGLAGPQYEEWYRKGVELQLRITNLYEYFMMSLDLTQDVVIPKTALIYFNYQNNLGYEYTAYLYRYILENEDKMPDLVINYRSRMEQFVAEQIAREHINTHLAAVYNRILTTEMINEQNAEPLSRLLFAYQVKVQDGRIRKVIVREPGRNTALEVPLLNGSAWVPIYGRDYTIGFADAVGNRYTDSVEYTLEQLMQPGQYLSALSVYLTENPELDFYLCTQADVELNRGNLVRYLRVMHNQNVHPLIRRDICMKIMDYYFDTEQKEELHQCLEQLDMQQLSKKERGIAVKYMVLEGKYQLAYQWVCRYGPDFVDVRTLVRMLSTLMEKGYNEGSHTMLSACSCAFDKKKYDGNILQYLVTYYQGPIRIMRDIWKAAVAYDIDCRYLCGDMLTQMLYCNSYVGEEMELFRYYVSRNGDRDLIKAFVARCCYDYFAADKLIEDCIFRELLRIYEAGEELPRICKYAFVKYYGENHDLINDSILAIAELFIHEMLAEDIHLNVMRSYTELEDVAALLEDRTIIEYHGHPNSSVRIVYCIIHENGESEEECTEYIRDICGGLCAKEFLLFFGESLQYYIVELLNGEETMTESAIIQKSEVGNGTENSKYQLINDIMLSRSMKDYTTMDQLLDEYFYKEFLNNRLFKPV